jgi:pyrroline-5-carboxylate reductase
MEIIAVLGAGKIGEALLSGLLAAGRPRAQLMFVERYPERAAQVSAALDLVEVDVATAAERADLLVVAVKPQDVASVLDELARHVRPGNVVVSLCAGVPAARFESRLPAETPVVRVMPNTPLLVGAGMSAVSAGRHATEKHVAAVHDLLSAVGRVVLVPEHQQDAVTALSGSGPAYFFYLVEGMIDAGVLLGLSRPVASELVVQTMLGSARMLTESGEHPAMLREGVTSPAGTTASALHELDRHAVKGALAQAIQAARDRSVQLGTS